MTPDWRPLAGGCHLNRRTVDVARDAGFASVTTRAHAGGYVQEITARNPEAA